MAELELPGYEVSFLTSQGKLLISLKRREMIRPEDLELFTKVMKQEVARKLASNDIDMIIIGGPMPLWLAATVVHELAHLVKAVALFEPKMKVAVIVSAHAPEYRVGQLLILGEEEVAFLLGA